MFQNFSRFENDPIDQTRQNLDNTRYANYTLSGFATMNSQEGHVQFATKQPSVMFGTVSNGQGIGGNLIDTDSALLLQTQQQRPLDKLSLNERPFITVPFMGRGMGDPVLESRLLQGEPSYEPRSVASVTQKSFLDHTLQPVDKNMKEFVEDTSYTIQESALNGWVRGGAGTRE